MILSIALFGLPIGLILFGLLVGRYENYAHERIVNKYLWIFKWLFSSIAYTLLTLIGVIIVILTCGIALAFIKSLFD